MIPLWTGVVLALAALALFSACEEALTSLSRLRLRQWVAKQVRGVPGPELLERPRQLITMTFVGTNLAKVTFAAAATVLLAREVAFVDRSPVLGALAVIAVCTPPAVLLGEVLPRAVVRERAGHLLTVLFSGGRVLAVLFWPYTALMNVVATILFKLLGVPRRPEERAFTRTSIESLLREGEREGVVDRHEREIIGGIFEFGETPVRAVMTPRPDVVSVQLGARREELARLIWQTGFSRFPVTDGSPENVVGIIHAVDVLKARPDDRLRLRPTLFVPETTPSTDLLYAMRRQRIQLAVVVDEYGGFAGIVTMEDLVEELVGDIRDEHDRREPSVAVEPGAGLVVSGRATLGGVAAALGAPLAESERDHTVAARLLEELGRVPAAGERVTWGGFTFEVLEATPKRIVRVRVRDGRAPDLAASAPAEGPAGSDGGPPDGAGRAGM